MLIASVFFSSISKIECSSSNSNSARDDRFPVGFEGRPNRHRVLLSILENEFGDLIQGFERGIEGLGPTMNDIWKSGKRLIICYSDKNMVNGRCRSTDMPYHFCLTSVFLHKFFFLVCML